LLYTTIKANFLPDFLSSGFIGLSTSVQQVDSVELAYFPDTCVASSPMLSDGYIALELKSQEHIWMDEVDYAVLKGPIPISQIAKIIFPSQDEKDMFYATYSGFPDVPLEMFELSVDQTGEFNLSNNYLVEKPTPRRSKVKYNASQHAAMVVGINIAFKVGGNHFKNFPSINVKKPSILKFGTCFVSAVLKASGFVESTPKISYDFLNLYLTVVEKIGINADFKATNITTELAESFENIADEGVSNHVKKALDRVSKVRMGLAEHPSLLDSPSNSLDRALYLACSVSSLEAFEYIKKNLRVGPIVQSLAAYLLATRLTLDQIEKEFWREGKNSFINTLDAAGVTLKTNFLSLDVSKSHVPDDFSTRTIVNVNGIEISNQLSAANYNVMLIVAMLKSCGYNPEPAEGDKIKICSGTSLNSDSFELILEHGIGPLKEHRQNVIISIFMKDSAYLFNSKKGRSQLFKVSQEKMVAIYACPRGNDLVVTRSQLTDTMDKDELEYHIELVKAATSDIRELS
jgi:hypothetical protein